MSFSTGRLSFRRFAVIGTAPNAPDDAMLTKLADHRFTSDEIGINDINYGWTGGRHIDDGAFSFERNVFNDAVSFALRIDTNKVPGAVKKSIQSVEEEAVAATNPSGFISRAQKRAVKDIVRQKVEEEMRTGKHRRTRAIEILWDVPDKMLYAAANGTAFELLADLFERTFGIELSPVCSASIARQTLSDQQCSDLRPSPFADAPDDSQVAEYPWAAKGAEPKNFLGNEFMTWLWWNSRNSKSVDDIIVFFDRVVTLDCVYGQTGKDAIRGDAPTSTPEALAALRIGKVPRTAGLIVYDGECQFEFTLAAETLAVSGAKLPPIDDADTPRVLFEERITSLRNFARAIDKLFAWFLVLRSGPEWAATLKRMRAWIARSAELREVKVEQPSPEFSEANAIDRINANIGKR